MQFRDFLQNFLKKKSDGQQERNAISSYTTPAEENARVPDGDGDARVRSENERGKFPNGTYCVVDLSGGPKARQYPCRFTNEAPDVSGDTCRTTELWLRRIPAGSFIMGSPESEQGRNNDETQHLVTLTQDYFLGIFPCTQQQYELVMGSNPSDYKCFEHSVMCVSYEKLIGTLEGWNRQWPFGTAVDAEAFFGRLQAKTCLMFDLPTEAQWEYGCRAGTITAFYGEVSDVAWYGDNSGEITHPVGQKTPNAWGLYDMHGNVWEWCLDWYGDYPKAPVINPKGAETGPFSSRVIRGGSSQCDARRCRSACRNSCDPADWYDSIGFRVALRA